MKSRCHPLFRLLRPQLLATLPLVTSASAVQVGYQYYRFTPIKLRNDATTNSVQLSEFDFLLSGAPISRAGVTVTNPGGSSSAAESPDKLIDGVTTTKWLDVNRSQVVFNFGSAATIDGYRFTTANDQDVRDPIRWLFEGSSDGSTWTLLDHQTSDFATPTARQTATSNILLPVSPAPYLFTWNGSLNNEWNTTTGNWDAGLWNNNDLLHARFTNGSPATVNLTEAITVRQIEATGAACTLEGSSISFASIRATGAGATTISNTAPLTIASAITGATGWQKTGSGDLNLTGASTYNGPTIITGGNVNVTGTGASTGGGTLALGTVAGSRAVLNMNSSGTLTHNTTVNVGGAGVSANGAGAINQTAGTVNLMNNTGYLQLGNGGYGSYHLSGGTLNFTSASGARIGDNTGGLGSFVQTGGTVNMTRFFVVGGNQGTAPVGVATLTGGTLNGSVNQQFIVGNGGTAVGALNVGTAAGGNATLVSRNGNGVDLANAGSATGFLNLNSGTIQFNSGVIKRTSTTTGTGIVNLNGGTLKANAADLTLINNTITSANVYNGGLKVDTQTNNATISANLLATTGNGIYPAGGILNQPAATGAGYIGAPLVGVTTSGSGTGASAVANVVNGEVTGVTLTCPGQGYATGDTVTFTFTGGGATTAAAPFAYVLTAGDVAANGAGGLTKLGSGKLTLSGTNTFTGPVSVEGTLASNSNFSLSNTTLAIHGFVPSTSSAPVDASVNGFTTGGIVQVQVDGTFSPGSWPLIFYPVGGSIGGSGIAALQLQTGSLPRGVVATLVDNTTNYSVDLNVTDFNPLTWKGNAGAVWDINTTTNWLIGATPEKYLEGDLVRFNDSATGTTSVTLNTTVVPQSVTFDNDTKDYTLSGTGTIGGTGTLTKTNNGTVTILNTNTFSGTTTVDGGTLQLGNGTVNGSIAGALVNNATVVFNPAGTATHAGAISGNSAGIFTKSGTGTQVITAGSNSSSGLFQVNEGTLQFGNGSTNGALGTADYEIAAGTSLRLEQATAATPPWADITGAGNIFLNTAQAVNGSADWGTLALPETYTGILRVEKGRVNATGGNTATGGAAKVEILSGAQFLAFSSVDPYTTPIEIAGTGWGENGYPGGLRLAGNATATWAGSVTLTADSSIMAQRGTNFTVTGAITGAHQCEFYSGDPVAENGNLIVAPSVPGQNTYASTKINGRPAGSVVAGGAQAFSTGPLVVDNAILKLNGNDASFASLSGAGGAIGNYHDTTPAALTVGSNGADTSYAGVLRDGAAAPLALVKTGTGTLTLSTAPTYTGNTTIAQGKLVVAAAYLADSSTVTVNSGAVLELNTAASDIVGSLVLGGTNVGPGTYNASHPTYGAYFAGSGSIVVGGAFESWAASKGLTGDDALPDADPDKDGIANLLEFVLGGEPNPTHPNANSAALLPTVSVDATDLVFTFRRTDDSASYDPVVEYGTALNAWTEAQAGVNGVVINEDNDFYGGATDRVIVRIPRTLAAPGSKLFARLKVLP